MQKNSDNFSIQQAIKMAKTPAGQQLLAMLRQTDDTRLQQAGTLASQGKYDQAQQLLSDLLSDPQVKSLLSQMGG